MKKAVLAVLLGLVAAPALAQVIAFHTGNMRHGTSVTGLMIVSCEYQAYGNTFWRSFEGGLCPLSIQVR